MITAAVSVSVVITLFAIIIGLSHLFDWLYEKPQRKRAEQEMEKEKLNYLKNLARQYNLPWPGMEE